ncbi:MAG: hypothetical protein ACHQ7H_12470 [Candidatus Rokuibacteriota bacterium]|jgi:hypothetical protein
MRVFGWGMVLALFVISGVSTYSAVELYGQRRSSSQQQKLKVLGRSPLAFEARKWTAGTPGAIDLTVCVAAGAAGLGLVGGVLMAVTSLRRTGGPGSACVDCGRPIPSGTLCETCETS